MKRLLLGSLVLTLFALSIMVFQISCQKNTQAQTNNYTLPPATTANLGGVIVGNGLSVTSNGTLSVTPSSTTQLGKVVFLKNLYDESLSPSMRAEIWIANYDLSNATKINIAIPSDRTYSNVKLSPDGTKIFFSAYAPPTSNTDGRNDIFSCDIDGTNLIQLTNSTLTSDYNLGGVY